MTEYRSPFSSEELSNMTQTFFCLGYSKGYNEGSQPKMSGEYVQSASSSGRPAYVQHAVSEIRDRTQQDILEQYSDLVDLADEAAATRSREITSEQWAEINSSVAQDLSQFTD